MTEDELRQCWLPARNKIESYYSVRHFKASAKLADLLGIDYTEVGYYHKLILTDELKHTLKLINGPYSKTIIKILEVKKWPRSVAGYHGRL